MWNGVKNEWCEQMTSKVFVKNINRNRTPGQCSLAKIFEFFGRHVPQEMEKQRRTLILYSIFSLAVQI